MTRRAVCLGAVVLAAAFILHAQAIAIDGIHAYQHALSPIVTRAGIRCRFTPTCSHYAEAVIARDGLIRGGWKTVRRVARCGPWTAPGTVDLP